MSVVHRLGWLAEVTVLALGCWVLGLLSIEVGASYQSFTSGVWLPVAFATAWLWIRGLRAWPGVLFGSALLLPSLEVPTALNVMVALSNLLAVTFTAALMRLLRVSPRLPVLRDVLWFSVLMAVLMPAVNAALGFASMQLLGEHVPDVPVLLLSWTLGNSLGVVALVPLMLVLSQPPLPALRAWLEGLLLMLVMLTISLLVFQNPADRDGAFRYQAALIPVFLLAALRVGQLGVALGAMFLTVLMFFGLSLKPESTQDLRHFAVHVLPPLQVFVCVVVLLGMSAATVLGERRRSELALQVSEQEQLARANQLEAVLDAVPVGVWVLHEDAAMPSGVRVYCNRLAQNVVQQREGDISLLNAAWNHRGAELLVDGQPLTVDAFASRVRAITTADHWENALIRYPNGRERHLQVYLAPFWGVDGRRLGTVLAITDLTDLHRALEEQRLADEVLQHTSEGLLVTDAHFRVVRVNMAFCHLTGFTSREALGEPPMSFVAEDQQAESGDEIADSLKARGHWSGEIWFRRKGGGTFPTWCSVSLVRNEEGDITHYISLFSDITERKQAEQRIRYLAQHDALTDLPNRILFQDRLALAIASARRQQEKLALLFIDLDRFKHINDTLGHAVGDGLLKLVAQRIAYGLRACDTVSRQGGDEFVVLLTALETPENAHTVAKKLLDTLSRPFSVDGHELTVSGSIGIAMFPDDGQDADTLLKHADLAMYHAKRSGRNNVQFYAEDMHLGATEFLRLEHGLRRALANAELMLHFQPQRRASDLALVGVEVLLRWHDGMEQVSPARFIPVAEESGLIITLGEWVLREACFAMRRLGVPGERLQVSVNVSAVQFQQQNFVGMVESALYDSGLPPHQLELEVTESVVMHAMEDVVAKLDRLAAMGVRIAIDDFGKGYSSLSYLKQLPIHKLKIDQAFVSECTHSRQDAAIVEAVIGMSRSLGLELVAEGVENPAQLAFLQARGCPLLQGYLLGRPQTEQALAQTLAEERTRDQPAADPAGLA